MGRGKLIHYFKNIYQPSPPPLSCQNCKSLFWNKPIRLYVYLYINLACLSACPSVCLYPINVKTAEPIRPKFFVWHHVIPWKVYGWSNFQKFASIKIRFLKILKIREIFFIFYLLTRRSPVYFIFTNEIKYRREAP